MAKTLRAGFGRRLRLSRHAQRRALRRGGAAAQHGAAAMMEQALGSGLRERRGQKVLHYDLGTRVGVLVDWGSHWVVTAMRLEGAAYVRLRRAAERSGVVIVGVKGDEGVPPPARDAPQFERATTAAPLPEVRGATDP